nr:hypothetical protein [Tanacetum cinerariifolium]
MPENSGIANLALQGGSGEGYGSLPTDFGVVEGRSMGERVYEARFQLNAKQANWRDDTDNEPKYQELKAHYMYMAQIQEVTPDAADNSGPIFDAEPLQKVKEYQEKDKIGSKSDKNEKRGKAGKSQKQLQSIKKEKLKKMQVEGPEMQTSTSFISERQREGLLLDLACNDHILLQGVKLCKLESYKVKENQEKDKIGLKPDKNEKRGEAGKSLKQLQWIEKEKLNKTQKEWPKTQTQSKVIKVYKKKEKKEGLKVHFP